MDYTRRKFLHALPSLAVLVKTATGVNSLPRVEIDNSKGIRGEKIKISLNAYSFNRPLSEGQMTLDDLLDFCAQLNFDALDLTAYYFPGYPDTPADKYLFHIKKKAFSLGLEISGTGIKNDFTEPDFNKRKKDIRLIKQWIDCAAKLGAPLIRVFAGKQAPENYTWDAIAEWMVDDFKECASYGEKQGIIVAVQNHNEFIKTADQTLKILKMVDSEWFGLVLDIGSLRTSDPYKEIACLAPYAVNWQIKEYVYRNGKQEKTDVTKIIEILRDINYHGYIPIETLGPGDPKEKVRIFLNEVKNALL